MTDLPKRAQSPETEAELMSRCELFAGLEMQQIASMLSFTLPPDLKRDKGYVGQLAEHLLGCDAGNLAQPDFVNLAIELKTLPVDGLGRVMESTYISMVPLTADKQHVWLDSVVYAKLKRVLWLPVEATKNLDLAKRRFGQAILWQPDNLLLSELQADYDYIMERVILGELEDLSATEGKYIQVRPKAANSKVLTETINSDGEVVKTLPRGFYLRPAFTQSIIDDWQKTSY